jgi:hypothetical protein
MWVASLQLSALLWVFLIASADEFPPVIQNCDQDKLHLLCELQTSGEIEVLVPTFRHNCATSLHWNFKLYLQFWFLSVGV